MRESLLLRLDTSPDPVRIWSGARKLVIPAGGTIDPLGATYLGFGELVNVPAVQQLINGAAERLEFVLSGVSAQVLGLAAESSTAIREVEARIGTVQFDAAWQIGGDIEWEWIGKADSLNTDSGAPDGQRVRSVTISVRSADTGRRRPRLAYFTDQDQRRRSANDNFCDHVAGINAGTTARFGPK